MKTGKIEEIRIEEIEEMETDTMSKLEKVFDTPNKKAFIGFLTAGDPDADSTVPVSYTHLTLPTKLEV